MMCGALWNDLPPLSGHQIQKLIDEKRGWQGLNSAPRDGDQFPANGAPELASVSGEGGHDAVQTLKAHRVGTGKELWVVFAAIVHAYK